MTRIIFQNGQILTADHMNAVSLPTLDGQDLIGHNQKLPDTYLSDDPTAMKAKFYNFYNRFLVSVNTGLVLNYNGGIVNEVGSVTNSSPGSLIVADNATTYIFISDDGTGVSVRQASSLPSACIALAKVTTLLGSIVSLTDLRFFGAENLPAALPSPVPVGSIIYSLQPSGVPTGYLECNGQAVSRSTYVNLFNTLGTAYGSGDGNSSFNLPNFANRFTLAVGTNPIGSTGGSSTFTLTTDNLPPHSHSITDSGHTHGTTQTPHVHGINDPGHAHSTYDPGHHHHWDYDMCGLDTYVGNYPANGNTNIGETTMHVDTDTRQTGIQIQPASTNISVQSNTIPIGVNVANTGITGTRNTGNGVPVSYTPPFIAARVFIKY